MITPFQNIAQTCAEGGLCLLISVCLTGEVSDKLRLYSIFKMLQNPLNSHGVAADQVPGPPLFCTPSHDSKSRRRHAVIIFISISLQQQNNSTGPSATFDSSVSIKHSRHFQRNKLETNHGSRAPLCPFYHRTLQVAFPHLRKGLICYSQP